MEERSAIEKDAVSAFHKRGDWRAVMDMYEGGFYDNSLLWFRPSLAALDFLRSNFESLQIKGVISIGCGTGLFEWLLHSFTGLPVLGFELDSDWWRSKYSPPQFWAQVQCVSPEALPVCDTRFALLFCYFSNEKAFQKYLADYSGPCVVLIGPDGDPRRFCDPPPFYLKDDPQWRIVAVHRNQFNDAVVVYNRS